MPYSERMQLALGRSRGYSLLADVAARGLTAEAIAPLRAVHTLVAYLPKSFNAAATDSAAADHYAVFGLNIFAYESIFVDPECRLAGEASSRVHAAYAAVGYAPPAGNEPDALAAELGCLAFLCGAESDAWGDRRPTEAEEVRRRQRAFLRRHLLAWLPALCDALARQPSPFYSAIAPLLAALCFDHFSDIAPLASHGAAAPESAAPQTDLHRTRLAEDLPVDDLSVNELCRRLLTPSLSGLFLARSDLTQLARSVDLPTSFGDRSRMLADLFHAAGRFERVPVLLNGLDQIVAAAVSAHAALEEESAAAAPFVAPWLEHLDRTRALLARLHRAALEQPISPTP